VTKEEIQQRISRFQIEIDQIEKATAILNTGLTEIKRIIRAGMTELENDGYLALIARREGQVQFIGHGIGLEIDAYPIISPRFDGILKEGRCGSN
jgi:Xaa-Pro aminopeptidase